MNLPNTLTVIRLVLIPVFGVSLALSHVDIALWVFVVAGVTDYLDGLAARVLDQRTKLGALLDPAADKLLLHVAYVSASCGGVLPWWPWAIL
ncbi:MAG: CDP-alcohol phosphatidyltransferase family protein, partial [Pseudomonadota bacterium]